MRLSTLAIFCCLFFAAPAAAEWSAPVQPENAAAGYWPPQAATDNSGAGVMAWTVQDRIVAALRRSDGSIGPVEELHSDGMLSDVAVGGSGRRAVLLWSNFPRNESLIAISDGGPFNVEPVPLPENQAAMGVTVEVHANGSLTVLWKHDAREMTQHLYAIDRAPDGSWGEAQQITQEKDQLTSFTSLTDASGTTWAFWTNSVNPSDPSWWAVFATHAPAGEHFSTPQQISRAHRGMRVGDPLAALANGRGDVAVLSPDEVLLKASGSGSFASAGAPAGYSSSFLPESDLALDEAGNIFVAWRAVDVLGAARPAGGTFQTTEVLARNTGTQAPPVVAYDGRGNLLYVDNSDDGLVASARPPDGSFSEPELLSGEGVWAYELRRLVPAGAGGLLLPWVTGPKPLSSGFDMTPHLLQLTTWTPLVDQPAPVVRRLRAEGRAVPLTNTASATRNRRRRARRAAFRFKLSESARASLVFEVKVTGKLFAGACYAPWTKVAGPPCDTWIPIGRPLHRKGEEGVNTLRLTRAQSDALAKLPAVRLVVAATDAGEKRGREKRLAFRVR